MAPQPHLNPLSKHLRLDHIPSIFFPYDPRSRQAVQYGIYICSAVFELYFLQLASVHELDAFAEFAFFEAGAVGDVEFFVQKLKLFDAIQTVDGREGIVQYIEVFLYFFVVDEGGQVEVVFGK